MIINSAVTLAFEHNITVYDASEIFTSFPGLSLTDASIVATMEKLGIRKLYSFDGGFDRIGWIERLE